MGENVQPEPTAPAAARSIYAVVWQGDRDEDKLRRMVKSYRASRWQLSVVRYFKLKWIINDAIHDLRME